MFPDGLQRRTTVFVIQIAVLVIALASIPYLTDRIGLTRTVDGDLVSKKEQLLNANGEPISDSGNTPIGRDLWDRTSVSYLNTGIKVIRLLLWLAIVICIVRYLSFVIFGTAFRNKGEEEFSSLLRTVLTVLIYIVAFFIVFQTQFPDIELAPLFTGSAIIGIVVGLALQDTLGNLFAGISLQADQSFQVGDVISVGTQGMGTVESVSWRGVKIRTFQDKLLVISNSVIGKETLEIAPKANLNARLVHFNTIYTTSPAKVIQVVREAVRQTENVSPKRKPKVRICNLGDNGIDWEVKYWATNYREFNDTDALIRQRIWYAFQREGMDFAYPTRTIYMADQSKEEEVFFENEDEIFERINSIPLFAPLCDDDIKRISSSCFVRVFAPNEPIIQSGQAGHSMFIIHRGQVNVQLFEGGIVEKVNTLGTGEFFGEMSLLTGEPRTADVVAETETKVIEISNVVLRPIFEANPDLIRIVGEIIDERRELLEKRREELIHETDADLSGPISKIKRFFGIE